MTETIPRQNPFQVLLLGACFLVSIPALAGDPSSGVLDALLDDLTVQLWGISLLIGSAVGLLGSVIPRNINHPDWRVTGLLMERAGLWLVAGDAAVYAGVIIKNADSFGDVRYTTGLQAAFVLGALWRSIQITRGIRDAKHLAAVVVSDER